MNSSVEYSLKSLVISEKYLPEYKLHTILGIIAFLMIIPSMFGVYVVIGLVGSISLLIITIINGYTQMKEENENAELIEEFLK